MWPVYINMFVVKLMFFFDFFLNHFPKTHRSVLRKITIDLFIFEMFMTSIYEKKILTEVLLIHAEQMSLCTSF